MKNVPAHAKGFTLIEMLIVIAIIAILVATLVTSFSGGTESARAAKCFANMKNLASATQSYGMATGYYPLASSVEIQSLGGQLAMRNVTDQTGEGRGWISWYAPGKYPATGAKSSRSDSMLVSCYGKEGDSQSEATHMYCLTNGTMWKFVSANRTVYQCPEHLKVARKKKLIPAWSYQMNAFFGCCQANNTQNGIKWVNYNPAGEVKFGRLLRADRILLFAEMPFFQYKGAGTPTFSTSGGDENDCTLLYDHKSLNLGDGSRPESFGFNHKAGRETVAHVCYADGHTEKLRLPHKGLSKSDAEELTTWLCRGVDVTFTGSHYEELK